MSFKFGVSHSSICASAERSTTNINDLNCRDEKIRKCNYENSKEKADFDSRNVFMLQIEREKLTVETI